MPIQGVISYSLLRRNPGSFGTTETVQVNFGKSNVLLQGSLGESYGPRRNKAGIAAVQCDSPLNFGGEASWVHVVFANNCTGVTFGLSSSGNGGAAGLFNVFFF